MLNALPTSFSTPELNVPCAEGEPHRVIEQLREQARFDGASEVITIDGLRADYADGFGLIRASNTTPVLVLRFEGHTAAGAASASSRLHGGAARGEARRAVRERRALSSPARPGRDDRARDCGRWCCVWRCRWCSLRLWWRGRREPGYRLAWRERLGFGYRPARRAPCGCMRCRWAKRAPPLR